MSYITLSDLGLPAWSRRASTYMGDLDVSTLCPLRSYMAQWQQGVASGDQNAVLQAMRGAMELAERLSTSASASSQTSSVLGQIAANLGNSLIPAIQESGLSVLSTGYQAPQDYRNTNGLVNLLVTGDCQQGAIAYETGANVTQAASTQTTAGIAVRQQALMQSVGQFQPGGRWNPTEILGLSAERIAPLQDEWVSIDNAINNASLTDSDRQALHARQKQILYVLGKKSAASTAAGSEVNKLIEKTCADLRALGLPCAGESGRDITTKPTWPFICATDPDPLKCLGPITNTVLGAAIGGAVGGIAGVLATESGVGSVVGLLSGGVLGGLAGYYMSPNAGGK